MLYGSIIIIIISIIIIIELLEPGTCHYMHVYILKQIHACSLKQSVATW